MVHSAKKERQLHMDMLRIFACFSVIMLHVAAQFWYTLPVSGQEWFVCNAYDASFRFGVPIFVMISGRFFLADTNEVSVRKLYSKHILRLLIAFCIWSIIYGIWDWRFWFGNEGVSWKDYATEMLMGRYHLWYLPMLIGIYIMLPILKSWVTNCDKKNIEYFLAIFVVFQLGISTLKIVYIPEQVLHVVNQFSDVEMACSYVGYFIWGHYLCRYPLTKKMQRLVYLGGVLGLIGAVGISTMVSVKKGIPDYVAFDSFSIFTFGITIAVYVFFQEVVGRKDFRKCEKVIRELSASTFGIYLLHILLLECLEDLGITCMEMFSVNINIAVGIPLLAVVSFLICGIVAVFLRHIPFVGKYIC